MMTPSCGTRLWEQTFTSGQVIKRVGSRPVEPYMVDGNYVIASHHRRPWRKQLNLLVGYAYFYNPFWLAALLVGKKTRVYHKQIGMQIAGMLGLIQTIRRTFVWALRLMFGKIERYAQPPSSSVPIRSICDRAADAGQEPAHLNGAGIRLAQRLAPRDSVKPLVAETAQAVPAIP
jgi:hypothetical protein